MKFIICKKDDTDNAIDLSHRITPPAISETNRTQSVNYTIGGAAVIDRISSSVKRRIELTIPLIPKEEWDKIKVILREMSFLAFWEDKGCEVRLDGEIPTPVLAASGDSYTAGDIKLELEEI